MMIDVIYEYRSFESTKNTAPNDKHLDRIKLYCESKKRHPSGQVRSLLWLNCLGNFRGLEKIREYPSDVCIYHKSMQKKRTEPTGAMC